MAPTIAPTIIISMRPLTLPYTINFPGKGYGVQEQTHTDCRNFQHDAKADASGHTAAGKTAGIDHYERENQKCLADHDPVKQAHRFALGSPKILRLRVNILEQHTVKEPSPEKDKNVRSNERNDESFHELRI